MEEFSEDEELLNEIVDSVGSFHSLEQRLFRVRNNIISPNPTSTTKVVLEAQWGI